MSRNELLLFSLSALILLFIATTFSVTAYHAKERSLAQQWYASGERDLAAGRAEAAIEDFRAALVYSHNDPLIEFQLAHALTVAGHLRQARAYLLALWEREPGNGTVNLELAQLAAGSGSVPEAIQYYHDALYAQWDKNPAQNRLLAGLDLAELLIKVGQKAQAQAELIALSGGLPNDPPLQTRVGTLLMQTGEYEHAAPLFRQALRVNPNYLPALEGAGEASFQTRDYSAVRRYLSRAKRLGTLSPQSQHLLETAALIQQSNPLAPRLRGQERASRALAAFNQGMERLSRCAAARGVSFDNGPQQSDLQRLHAQAVALQPKVNTRNLARDSDLLLQTTDMAFQIEQVTERACGEPQGLDLALLLLSRTQEGANE
ncbi:MAG: tetratricopeptide repeat protein [Terriglobia bacterium]|jgi:tetratricopeptide (TPR) repeat protein